MFYKADVYKSRSFCVCVCMLFTGVIVYCVSNLFIFVNLGVLIVNSIVNTILLNMSYWTKRRKINASVAMQVASLTRECYLPSLRTVNSS